jgi:hypothetical protein
MSMAAHLVVVEVCHFVEVTASVTCEHAAAQQVPIRVGRLRY